MKKTLSIFLSIVLAMTSCVFAISASADDSKYTFDKNTKTITITGVTTVSASLFDDFEKVYGNAVNNSSDESASTSPSGDAYSVVENICLEKGVQTVEKNAFADFSNLKNLIVYNPYCSLAPEGILASVNRVAIYTFDVNNSTVKAYAEKRDDIDSKSIYSITFTVNGKSTTVNALEGETAKELAAKAPEFPFEAYHSHKNDVDTYYKWSPELTDVSASASYKAILSSKVACQHIEKVVKEATCQEEGLVQVICAVTGDVIGENVISKIPHKFDNNAEYCAYGCGTKNPNYKAPVNPSQPVVPSTAPATSTTTSTTQPASPAPSTTKAAAPTANAKKVGGVWVDRKLKKASISKLKKGKKSIKATWKKVSKIKGYQIQVATDKKFKKNKKTVTVSKQKTTKTTIKKLKAKKKYYVRIRTYKNAKYNGKTVKVYSSWSKVKTIKTK